MKETDGETLTKRRLTLLAGRCALCKLCVINGDGEKGPEWDECTFEYREDIELWDERWGYELPCPFSVSDLHFCAEHKEITTSMPGCAICLKEHIESEFGGGVGG